MDKIAKDKRVQEAFKQVFQYSEQDGDIERFVKKHIKTFVSDIVRGYEKTKAMEEASKEFDTIHREVDI